MTADEFVMRLESIAPHDDQLAAVGVFGAEALEIRQQFKAPPRPGRVPAEDRLSDAAIDLVEFWDASQLEIGMLRFARCSVPDARGSQVGTVEADSLVVYGRTGELVVCELATSDHVLWPVGEWPAAARCTDCRGRGVAAKAVQIRSCRSR